MLIDGVDPVDAERFISLVNRDHFDYTEWQKGKLTKAQQKLRAAAIAKGSAVMAEIHSRPGMEESYAEWKKEYDATFAKYLRACAIIFLVCGNG